MKNFTQWLFNEAFYIDSVGKIDVKQVPPDEHSYFKDRYNLILKYSSGGVDQQIGEIRQIKGYRDYKPAGRRYVTSRKEILQWTGWLTHADGKAVDKQKYGRTAIYPFRSKKEAIEKIADFYVQAIQNEDREP